MAQQLFKVNMRLKGEGLGVSLKALQAKTGRLPSYLANKACYNIGRKAARAMKRVEPSVMDSELEVSAHGITKLGRLSKAKKPRKVSIGSGQNSFASWIVLASFYKDSKFNITTGQIFARGKPDTHGSAAFWAWMSETVARMVKARHSSAGFYRLCAQAIELVFLGVTKNPPVNVPRWLDQGDPFEPGGGNVTSKIGKVAGGAPATGVRDTARATFWVAATESDTKGGRMGLEKVAQPVWQKAVDETAAENIAFAGEVYRVAIRETGIPVH